jgi:hypothetical protein
MSRAFYMLMLAFPVRCLQNYFFFLLACVCEREGVLVAVAMLAEGRKEGFLRCEREGERAAGCRRVRASRRLRYTCGVSVMIVQSS